MHTWLPNTWYFWPVAKANPKEAPTYAAALARLQVVVSNLENGALGIDQMLAQLAEAEQLVAFCRTKLRDADANVEEIVARMRGV